MIFTIITIIFAIILIVLSAISVEEKDIVRSIIFLMAFLFVLSANFIFLGATLVGAIELLVYVGAVPAYCACTKINCGIYLSLIPLILLIQIHHCNREIWAYLFTKCASHTVISTQKDPEPESIWYVTLNFGILNCDWLLKEMLEYSKHPHNGTDYWDSLRFLHFFYFYHAIPPNIMIPVIIRLINEIGSKYFHPKFTNLSILTLGIDSQIVSDITTSTSVFIISHINPA